VEDVMKKVAMFLSVMFCLVVFNAIQAQAWDTNEWGNENTESSDEWSDAEKPINFAVATAATGVFYIIYYKGFKWSREVSLVAAAGTTIALGFAREIYDDHNSGDFSWKNMAMIGGGTALATTICFTFDGDFKKVKLGN
jgi:hypothetical protein